MKNFILKTIIWIIFLINKEELPTKSNNKKPKIEYEGMSGAFIWEDEGLWELKNRYFLDFFKYVINHRMKLVVGSKNDVECMHSYSFDKQIFEMAKRYYPDRIGFEESRCSYNQELAKRIMRIKKVVDWRFQKLFNE